jgi:hypothetical protein
MADDPATTLLTLDEAAAILHPTIKASTLRAAIRDRRLPRRKIGRRYYLTAFDIKDLVGTCPGPGSPPVSTIEQTNTNGSSATATGRSGRDMALASVERLKRSSRNTSPAASRPSATVLPIRTK